MQAQRTYVCVITASSPSVTQTLQKSEDFVFMTIVMGRFLLTTGLNVKAAWAVAFAC